MRITEIYKNHNINRGLQEHMLRVASVAKMICDSYKNAVDSTTIVSACLLHDVGNPIKSKLEMAPELFEPEGIEYWKGKKEEMVKSYGSNVHTATIAIVKKITNNNDIVKLIDDMSFDRIEETAISGSIEAKIALYSDMRVGMNGIISLDERFDDIKNRYVPNRFSEEECEVRRQAGIKIEQDLFGALTTGPEDINDALTKSTQEELKDWNIV